MLGIKVCSLQMCSEGFVASFYFQMARGDQHDLMCQTIKSWEAWNLKLSFENCSGIQKSDEITWVLHINRGQCSGVDTWHRAVLGDKTLRLPQTIRMSSPKCDLITASGTGLKQQVWIIGDFSCVRVNVVYKPRVLCKWGVLNVSKCPTGANFHCGSEHREEITCAIHPAEWEDSWHHVCNILSLT